MATVHNMTPQLTRRPMGKTNETLNFIRSRLSSFLGFTHEGARDLYATFGYPREVSTNLLWALYLRGGIAQRIVRSFPQATWREHPTVGDGEGDSSETGESFSTFSYEVDKLLKKHNVIHYLERADRVASIGRYGILVMGFKDGVPLTQPVGKADLAYLSPYSELNVTISKWDTDPKSERFGKPELYQVSGNSIIDAGATRGPTNAFTIHHSRVLHIAEFLEEDDTFGVPCLLPIINYLQDLDKVVGGSAETFWLTANRGVAFWADKDAVMTDEQIADLKKQAEDFSNQQQRWMTGQGMTAQVLRSESPDPTGNAEKILDLIAGTKRIPKRILIGSERGELSSGQDENAWNLVIDERRTNFAGPCILKRFLIRMVETGNLPEPKPKEKPKNTSGEMKKPISLYKPPAPTPPAFNKDKEDEIDFEITWPETATIGPVEESTVAVNLTNALTNYAKSPGVELVMPVPEFRKKILNLEPESEYELPELEEDLPEDGVDPLTGEPLAPDDQAAEGDTGEEDKPAPTINLGAAKSLYVRRDVLNRASLKTWAKKQGLTLVSDPHVTVCYSETPVVWDEVKPAELNLADEEDKGSGTLMVVPSEARTMTVFGDKLVLEIKSASLQERHNQFRAAGASHKWETYRPHVTICDAGGIDVATVEPYQGAIALGPEVFEEVKE